MKHLLSSVLGLAIATITSVTAAEMSTEIRARDTDTASGVEGAVSTQHSRTWVHHLLIVARCL